VNEAQATWRELEKDIIHKFTTYNPWFKQNLVPLPLLWRAWESKDLATSKEWSKGNCYLLNPFKLHQLLNETSRLVRFHEYLTPARTIARAGTPPYTERATRRAISARLIPDLRYNWTGSDSLHASRILIKIPPKIWIFCSYRTYFLDAKDPKHIVNWCELMSTRVLWRFFSNLFSRSNWFNLAPAIGHPRIRSYCRRCFGYLGFGSEVAGLPHGKGCELHQMWVNIKHWIYKILQVLCWSWR